MRADLGPYLVDLVFAGTGLAVLLALGLTDLRPARLLAALGLGYLTGVAVVCIPMLWLLQAGVTASIPLFLVIAAVATIASAAVVVVRLKRGRARLELRRPRLRRPRWNADGVVIALFVVVAGAFLAVGYAYARVVLLDAPDAWAIWTFKAVALTETSGFPSQFLAAPQYATIHPEYPLLLPLFESLHFRAAGTNDTQALHAWIWLLLCGWVWGTAYVASRVARPAVWAPVLLLAIAGSGLYNGTLTAYADLPVAFFLGTGTLLVGLWVADRRPAELALGALLLAAAASIKNEGMMGAFVVVAAAVIVVAFGRRWADLRALGLAAAGLLAVVLPWRIWVGANDIYSAIDFGQAVKPGYVADRLDHFWPAVKRIATEVTAPGAWNYLVPIALAAVLIAYLAGRPRRVASFYLLSGAGFYAALVWNYIVNREGESATDPTGQFERLLTSTASRVVSGLVLICAAAAIHLAGRLSVEDDATSAGRLRAAGPEQSPPP